MPMSTNQDENTTVDTFIQTITTFNYILIWLFGLILLIYLVAYRSGTSPILVNKNLGRVSHSRHWLGSFVRAGGLGGSA